MDVIITDHHEPGDVLPDANVIIHPRIPAGHYPFGELAGVGVAFKLAHAFTVSYLTIYLNMWRLARLPI